MKLLYFTVFLVTINLNGVKSKAYRNINVINKSNTFSLSNKILQYSLINDAVAQSLEISLANCKKQFEWDRWNCPTDDFLTKRSSPNFDRESGYVQAITVAALIYTISKNCSIIAKNSQLHDQQISIKKCANNLDTVDGVIKELLEYGNQTNLDIQSFAEIHNNRAGRIAVRKSYRKNCACKNDSCNSEFCWLTSNTFSQIAADIRRMYDRSIILSIDNKGNFNRNIREDSLVYVIDSPNYCAFDAIPGWMGMKGRRCSRNKTDGLSRYEKRSCRTLCRSCGLHVRKQVVVKRNHCNCKFHWCCNVTCDVCEEVQHKFFCD